MQWRLPKVAVRYLGEIPDTEAATRKLVAKLAAKYDKLTFCYEAGLTVVGAREHARTALKIRLLAPACLRERALNKAGNRTMLVLVLQ